MTAGPSASAITVLETLKRLDTDFAAVVDGIERGEFALWVGSGISRRAPSLGGLIRRAIEFIRLKVVDPATQAKFEPVLLNALALAGVDPEAQRGNFASPFDTWAEHEAIVNALWNQYSKFLDIPVDGEEPDYLLWDAVDIRRAFENPEPPAAEHLCIAILILEGAVREIASGNWDGFIETAVERLSPGVPNLLQVVVDPTCSKRQPGVLPRGMSYIAPRPTPQVSSKFRPSTNSGSCRAKVLAFSRRVRRSLEICLGSGFVPTRALVSKSSSVSSTSTRFK